MKRNMSEFALLMDYLTITILCVLFVFVSICNISVLVSIRKSRHKSRMHFFIVNLVLSDLLVGFGSILPNLIWKVTFEFHGPTFVCKLTKFIMCVVTSGSTYALVSLSIDRWYAIVMPLTRMTSQSSYKYMVVGIGWFFAVVLNLPDVIQIRVYETNGMGQQCWIMERSQFTWKVYFVTMCLSIFIIPAVLIAALHMAIIFKIWKSTQRREEMMGTPKHSENCQITSSNDLVRRSTVTSDVHTCRLKNGNHISNPYTDSKEAKPIQNNTPSKTPQDKEGYNANTKPSKYFIYFHRRAEKGLQETIATQSNFEEGQGRTYKAHPEDLQNGQEGVSLVVMSSRSSINDLYDSDEGTVHIGGRHGDAICASAQPCIEPVGHGHKTNGGTISRSKIRSVQLTFAIVAAFVICWSPYMVWNFLDVFNIFNAKQYRIITIFINQLSSINSAMNPVIYWLFNSKGCCFTRGHPTSPRHRRIKYVPSPMSTII